MAPSPPPTKLSKLQHKDCEKAKSSRVKSAFAQNIHPQGETQALESKVQLSSVPLCHYNRVLDANAHQTFHTALRNEITSQSDRILELDTTNTSESEYTVRILQDNSVCL